MYIRHETGKKGEDIACQYLQKNRYKILQRNFISRYGEIDIIAKDRQTRELVLIEVKTRKQCYYGLPSESVTKIKQKHILMVGKYYLYQKHIENMPVRLDVIEVYLSQNNFRVNHIKQAF